jgi:hypothetical protein
MNIYGKIAEFQKNCPAIRKTADNPYFHSKYAPLNEIIETVFPHLWEAGLMYLERVDGMSLHGTIADVESGETLTGTYPIVSPEPDNPQKVGGSVTYARRYLMCTMLSIALEDDDGNAASEKRKTPVAKRKQAAPPDDPFEDAPIDTAAHIGQPDNPFEDEPVLGGWPEVRHAFLQTYGQFLTGTANAHHTGTMGSAAQYNFLAGRIDKLTDGEEHRFILSVLCDDDITKDNRPSSQMARKLLDAILEQHKPQGSDEWVDNPSFNPAVVQILQKIYSNTFGGDDIPW